MNKLRYRLVFNKARGMLMAVSEAARSHGKGPGESAAPAGFGALWGAPPLLPLALVLTCAFGGALVSGAALAQIVADSNAPGNQRPTVLSAANGVIQVNIQTPSAAGVSRNVYSQFDVPKGGAILNNSRTDAQTQLGGWVQANPWMKGGTARVILNEVNSSNPSQLQGFVEVAGQRAEAVIANPAGIVINGGGFINVSRATMTTGNPMLVNGQITGFDVQRGRIVLEGAGLNASQTDYTALIARSVQINAGLWAPRVNVVAGINQVSNDATPDVKASGQASTNDADTPRYAIDVTQLGGMYANQIWLVGTEAGVGVRNAGEIGAAAGELVVTASGRLENRGSMEAAGRLSVTGQAIDNAGSVRATGAIALSADALRNGGEVVTHGDATITLVGQLDNSGGVIEADRIEIASGALRNRAGSIAQSGSMALTLTAQQLSNNDGVLGQAAVTAMPEAGDAGVPSMPLPGSVTPGPVATAPIQPPVSTAPGPAPIRVAGVLSATAIDNDGGRIVASGGLQTSSAGFINRGGQAHLERLTVTGPVFDNAAGTLQVRGALDAIADSFGNRDGKVVVGGVAQVKAVTLDNSGGTLQASQLALQAGALDNSGGTLRHTGAAPVTLTVEGELRQQKGTIDSAAALTLRAGQISGARGVLNITGDLDLKSGATSAEQGSWRIGGDARIQTAGLAAAGSSISADGDLMLDSDTLDNTGGKIVAGASATVRAGTALDNTGGLIQATAALDVAAGSVLRNRAGTVETLGARTQLSIKALDIENTSGRLVNAGLGATIVEAGSIASSGLIGGNGRVVVQAGELVNNTGGRIVAAFDLTLTVNGLLANHGAVATASGGQGALTVAARRLDNDAGVLQSDAGARIVLDGSLSNSGGTIAAAAGLLLQAGGDIGNTAGSILGQRLEVRGANIGNDGGRINGSGSDAAIVQASGAIDNNGAIGARGALVLGAQVLDNRAQGEIAAQAALTLNVDGRLANAGRISSSGALTIDERSATLHNSGAIIAGDLLRLNVGRIDNAGGDIASVDGVAMTITANTLGNRGGRIIAGAASELDIAADIDNTGGLVQAAGALRIDAGTMLDNASGVIETLGAAGTLQLAAGAIDNSAGRIVNVGSGDTSVTAAGHLASSGLIAGNGALNLAARTVQTGGELRSAGDMALAVSERFDNSGTLSAARGLRLQQVDAAVRNSGVIVAGGDIVLAAKELDNSKGNIATARGSNADLALSAARIVNDGGAIMAERSAMLAATGELSNAGGLLQAGAHLQIDAGAGFDNRGGTAETLSGAGTLQLGAAALLNDAGRIVNTGSGDTKVNIAGMLDNGSGMLAGNGALALQAHDANSGVGGSIAAGAALTLYAAGRVDNAGTLGSRGTLVLDAAALKNRATLVAGAAASITTGLLDNDGGQIATAAGSGARLAVRADSLSNRDGRMVAEDALTVSVQSALDNAKGVLQA
jgi:filamentous hemagglutinin